MAEKDLIPLNKRSKEERFAIQSMGGKTVTEKQLWVNRLNALKRKGLSNENYDRFYGIMTEKKYYIFDAIERFEKWYDECQDVKEKALIGRLINDTMKMVHGDGNKHETNIQINMLNKEDTENAIVRLLDEDNSETVGDDTEEQ